MNISRLNATSISQPNAASRTHAGRGAEASDASSEPGDSVHLSSEARSELDGHDVVTVHNADELRNALARARDGQTVHLAKGEYHGSFKLDDVSGVTIEGEKGTKLIGDSTKSGTTLALDNVQNSTVKGLEISGGQKGLLLDHSSKNTLTGLDVGNTGKEAVHLREDSSNNLLTQSDIHDAGRDTAGNGEGVYVGSSWKHWDLTGGRPDHSDNNRIVGNHIHGTQSEAIDVKEGTTGTVVANNQLDGGAIRGENGANSLVSLKGNGARLSGNAYDKQGNGRVEQDVKIQTFDQAPGWARGNRIDDTRDVRR